MTTIFFGLALDESSFPHTTKSAGGTRYLGPQKLLHFLESSLGYIGHSNNNDYLRIEQYRQAILQYLEKYPDPFFKASFEADEFATAAELLRRRDELYLAGYSFQATNQSPIRLQCLSQLEQIVRTSSPLDFGFADRFRAISKALDTKSVPIQTIYLNEPQTILPFWLQEIFKKLVTAGVVLKKIPTPSSTPSSDLKKWYDCIHYPLQPGEKKKLEQDGSLLIIKAKRETALAAFLAGLFTENLSFKPLCLIPNKNRTLDNAMLQEGLPSMGIPAASLARPTLQVLKLATVFLWDPIDPYKILEFVSLRIKPLPDELANRIATQMAKNPGIKSVEWEKMIGQFFQELRSKADTDPTIDLLEIRTQYNFWFERKRYDSSEPVPKKEVIEIFQYLQNWANQTFDKGGKENNALELLAEQCNRIQELLATLPEHQLSNLQLERVVRTIYEPAPVALRPMEKGALPYIDHPHALIGAVDHLIWWNFIQNERDYFFSKWYGKERAYLEKQHIFLETPADQNNRLIWQRNRPLVYVQKKLILAIPEYVSGQETQAHTLFGDLEAIFENLEDIMVEIGNPESEQKLAQWFTLKNRKLLSIHPLAHPKPFIQLPANWIFEQRSHETLSSLESLFYYPYQWIFRHKLKLQKLSILSVVKDQTLMGNLAHRFIEKLFENAPYHWTKPQLEKWFDKEAYELLQKEGATLLLYGREPERVGFIQRLKFATWSLLTLLRENNWQDAQTEETGEGTFVDTPIKGRADLIVNRDNEQMIIDLKWRGARRRERMIKNREDLQLVLYAHLFKDGVLWPHTAYFILENGKMVARNNEGFKEIIAVNPEANHSQINEEIYQSMEATYNWRMKQLKAGKIEVRCEQTQFLLEEIYADETEDLQELLEMKEGNAPFDDYQTLINLIQ